MTWVLMRRSGWLLDSGKCRPGAETNRITAQPAWWIGRGMSRVHERYGGSDTTLF